MRRRDFIAALGGAAVMPLVARAQERVRRIGVLLPGSSDNAEWQARNGAFLQGLALLGWTSAAVAPLLEARRSKVIRRVAKIFKAR